MIYTWEISDLFEQCNTKYNLWTSSWKNSKLVVVTACDSSNSFETIFSKTVNDLYAVVVDFFWNLVEIKLQYSCYISFKDFKVNFIFNVRYSVDYKTLILTPTIHWLWAFPELFSESPHIESTLTYSSQYNSEIW